MNETPTLVQATILHTNLPIRSLSGAITAVMHGMDRLDHQREVEEIDEDSSAQGVWNVEVTELELSELVRSGILTFARSGGYVVEAEMQ